MAKYARMFGRQEGGNSTSLCDSRNFTVETARQRHVVKKNAISISRAGYIEVSGLLETFFWITSNDDRFMHNSGRRSILANRQHVFVLHDRKRSLLQSVLIRDSPQVTMPVHTGLPAGTLQQVTEKYQQIYCSTQQTYHRLKKS